MADISLKTAAIYNAVSKYGSMAVQLGLTMILSRLIVPEAFGVIAITTVIIGFLHLFADIGLGITIIQHPSMSKDNIGRLFTFTIFIGIILSIITGLSSIPLSKFYDDNIYYHICPIISFVAFFNAINIVPNSILIRDRKFKLIAVRTILCSIVSGIIAIIFALQSFGVYALVLQTLIFSLGLFLWNYYHTRPKIERFLWGELRTILGKYSFYQVLFNFLNYLTRNLDSLVIGKLFGNTNLAYYNKSYTLYLYPNNIFTSVITGVLHTYVREYSNNYEKMYEKYISIIRLLSLIGVFTMITFFFCSHEIIIIMFGDNWQPASYCLKGLSICMWTQMMSSVPGSIFLGLERTEQVFKCGIINLVLILLSITAGAIFNSIFILSISIGISYNIIFIVTNYILLNKTMSINISSFLSHIYKDGIFAFSFLVISLYIPNMTENIYINFVYKMCIVFVSYILFLLITKQYLTLLSLIKTIRK